MATLRIEKEILISEWNNNKWKLIKMFDHDPASREPFVALLYNGRKIETTRGCTGGNDDEVFQKNH